MKCIKNLSELSPKDRGITKKIEKLGTLNRKSLDIGVIPGSNIEIVKLAPLGDPVDIKIKGYHLSLRKAEASQISVKVIE